MAIDKIVLDHTKYRIERMSVAAIMKLIEWLAVEIVKRELHLNALTIDELHELHNWMCGLKKIAEAEAAEADDPA